jgi:hypothetical protein
MVEPAVPEGANRGMILVPGSQSMSIFIEAQSRGMRLSGAVTFGQNQGRPSVFAEMLEWTRQTVLGH